MWCQAVEQAAPPQYPRRVARSANTVERTVDSKRAARKISTEERAVRADAPIVGSLRHSVTARATRGTIAMRAIRAMRATHTIQAEQAIRAKLATQAQHERVGEGPAGATAKSHPAVQATRREGQLHTGELAEAHSVARAP